MSTIVLKTCNTSFEANLIKGKLENNGIKCFLSNENFSNLMPHYNGVMGSGVQVCIDEADLEKSQLLLGGNPDEHRMICPHCKSENVRFGPGKRKFNKIITIILSLAIWIPFGNLRNTYYCEDCRREFKEEL